MKWIVELFFKPLTVEEQVKGIQLQCHTEYTRQGVTFRYHPNYKIKGPWYDYFLVAWDNPNSDKYQKLKKKPSSNCIESDLQNPVMTQEKETTSNVLLIPAKMMCFVQDDNDN